ncbi:hypothetical protein [Serinibacter arcticus]|uniref:Uncharacterized protein n=1 Tax=Serinibacter arcticus TaxID=1655435 RepID=A0A4Z1E5K3_9MICO|nr:hypothetical protein [Serinibacter arcticus]TGO06158.1 hypothetical protein SERN_0350 [Serinibacter arcticus]
MTTVPRPVSIAPRSTMRAAAHVLVTTGADLVPLDPAAAVAAPTPSDVWCALTPDVRSQLLRSHGSDLTPEQVVSLGDAGGVVVLGDAGRWEVGDDLCRFIAQLTRLLELTD